MSEPRYLDAERLKRQFADFLVGEETVYSARFIRNVIDDEPTADVVPVRHAELIWRDRTHLVPTGKIRTDEYGHSYAEREHVVERIPYCSACHFRQYGEFLQFCDNCGAIMDGGETKND